MAADDAGAFRQRCQPRRKDKLARDPSLCVCARDVVMTLVGNNHPVFSQIEISPSPVYDDTLFMRRSFVAVFCGELFEVVFSSQRAFYFTRDRPKIRGNMLTLSIKKVLMKALFEINVDVNVFSCRIVIEVTINNLVSKRLRI